MIDDLKDKNSEYNLNQDTNKAQDQDKDKKAEKINCCQELSDIKSKYIYLMAEFDNYKRRTEKEKSQAILYGEFLVFRDLLSILDDFERAFGQIAKVEDKKEIEKIEQHISGFKLIYKEFEKLLKKYNIKEVEYKEFNPEIHEAIMQKKSENHKPGDIIQVLEKGYTHKGQLLRPAKVSVAQ